MPLDVDIPQIRKNAQVAEEIWHDVYSQIAKMLTSLGLLIIQLALSFIALSEQADDDERNSLSVFSILCIMPFTFYLSYRRMEAISKILAQPRITKALEQENAEELSKIKADVYSFFTLGQEIKPQLDDFDHRFLPALYYGNMLLSAYSGGTRGAIISAGTAVTCELADTARVLLRNS